MNTPSDISATYLKIIRTCTLFILCLGFIGTIAVIGAHDVYAQSNIGIGDYVVEPARTEITAIPGTASVKQVKVISRIPGISTYKVYVEDIKGSSKKEQAVEITENIPTSESSPYSLKPFVSLSQKEFSLTEGESKTINVSIDIPEGVAPGGYYGAVLVEGKSKQGNPLQGSGAYVISRVASVLLVRVDGLVNPQAKIKDFSIVQSGFFHATVPNKFEVAIENTGNVHTIPYGTLIMKNFFGGVIARKDIAAFVTLPESVRYVFPEIEVRKFALGLYTAELDIQHGYDNYTEKMTRRFAVIPYWFMLLIACTIIYLVYRNTKKVRSKR
jgi:hypothetical protein